MGRRHSLLLLIGGTALVCGAVLALGHGSSALARVGGCALVVAGVAALVVWTRQSRLMTVERFGLDDDAEPSGRPE